jgi:hypothetical protein
MKNKREIFKNSDSDCSLKKNPPTVLPYSWGICFFVRLELHPFLSGDIVACAKRNSIFRYNILKIIQTSDNSP